MSENMNDVKHYTLIMHIDATPEGMRGFREKLDEMCDNGPEFAEFTVYRAVPYMEE